MARFKLRKVRAQHLIWTATLTPTLAPTLAPTLTPTLAPTLTPTLAPTLAPTLGAQALLHWRHRKLTLSFRSLVTMVFRTRIEEAKR